MSLKGYKQTTEHIRNIALAKGKVPTIITLCKVCNKEMLHRITGKKIFCSNSCHLKFKIATNSEWHKQVSLLGGLAAAGKGGKITAAKYGGWYSVNKVMKEKNPEKYDEFKKRSYFNSMKSARRNKNIKFLDINFDSAEEMEVCKICINEIATFFPKEGKTVHIKIGFKEIDFKPFNNIFFEYHPWDWDGKTIDEYYNERRELLDNNNHKDMKLFVFTNLQQVKQFFETKKDIVDSV